jgi:hypothetical protein
MNTVMKLKIPNVGWEILDNVSECHLVDRDSASVISLVNWFVQNKTHFSVFGN